MLIRFSSVATGSIVMFGGVAMLLIKMLGASNALPGAIGTEDIPAAVKRLKDGLAMHAANVTDSAGLDDSNDDKAEADYDPPIALASRAGPLIDILVRAAVAQAPVMWEKA